MQHAFRAIGTVCFLVALTAGAACTQPARKPRNTTVGGNGGSYEPPARDGRAPSSSDGPPPMSPDRPPASSDAPTSDSTPAITDAGRSDLAPAVDVDDGRPAQDRAATSDGTSAAVGKHVILDTDANN